MRQRKRRVLVVGSVVAIAGIVGLIAVPAVAEERRPQPIGPFSPPSFSDLNPCTGEIHEISRSIEGQIQMFESNGGRQVTGHAFFTVTTSDGFTGAARHNFHETVKEDGHTFTNVLNAILDNDETGQRIRVHHRVHITLRDGEVTADFSDIDLDCVQ